MSVFRSKAQGLSVVRRQPAAGAAGANGAGANGADAADVAAITVDAAGKPLHPVLQRIYVLRGIHSAADIALSTRNLLPVGTLRGTDAAAELLLQHRAAGGLILVIGDFDADGATSTALMLRVLRAWGFPRVEFLVPNRFEYGYGLTPEIVALALQQSPSLIVTVDNGTASEAGVKAAREAGVDVIITDHHLPGERLPAANVIVNPNVPGCTFESRALAGVGVAFYVLAALGRLLEAQGQAPTPPVAEWLDLVALGTVADVVPLDRNNRILVAQGLARIRAARCSPGISALLAVAKRNQATIVASDLGFAVGPRLNAAGRLTDMSVGIKCLLADTPAEAAQLAAELDRLNVERREIESQMQAQALAAVRQLRDPASGVRRHGVCLFDDGWHQGVVGLVASRVKEQLRRPVIAFAKADAAGSLLRGSARSVPGVHIRDVLDAMAARNPELIDKFGGHAMAAGVTLRADRLDEFARAFDSECQQAMASLDALDVVHTDGELSTQELSLGTADALRGGGPWGQGFPEPTFDGRFRVLSARVVGQRHLKLTVAAPEGRGHFDAIAFNSVDPNSTPSLPEGQVHLVYRLESNEYQGERRLQLLVEHVLESRP